MLSVFGCASKAIRRQPIQHIAALRPSGFAVSARAPSRAVSLPNSAAVPFRTSLCKLGRSFATTRRPRKVTKANVKDANAIVVDGPKRKCVMPLDYEVFNELARKGRICKVAELGNPVLLRPCADIDPLSEEAQRIVADLCATAADRTEGFYGLAAPQIYENKRIIMYQVPGEHFDYEPEEHEPNCPHSPSSGPAHHHHHDGEPCNHDHGHSGGIQATILFNARYAPLRENEEQLYGWEGCFSLPKMLGEVKRFSAIKYTGQQIDGTWVEGIARGVHARVLQHEIDHLDGTHYLMRMDDMSRLGFQDEIMRSGQFFARKSEVAGKDDDEEADS